MFKKKRGNNAKFKLERYYTVDVITGCWNGLLATSRDGYCSVSIKGKKHKLHRLAYSMIKESVPSSMQIDHICKNKRCCNPEHLRIVTNKVNSRDRTTTKITEQDAVKIKELSKTMIQKDIATLFGLSQSHVSHIIIGRKWN